MLQDLYRKLEQVDCLEATVTRDNPASAKMCEKFAATIGAEMHKELLFDSNLHLDGNEENEYLLSIKSVKMARRCRRR